MRHFATQLKITPSVSALTQDLVSRWASEAGTVTSHKRVPPGVS